MFAHLPRLSLVSLLSLVSGCSLLYDFNKTQCLQASDCLSYGPDFKGSSCVSHVCVRPQATGGAGTGGTGTGGAALGGQGGTGGCTTNRACITKANDYRPAVCIKGACVNLLSGECPQLLPLDQQLQDAALDSEDPLIFGGYADVVSGGSAMLDNYDLAVTELLRKVNGIPGDGSTRRKVLGVVCQNIDTKSEGHAFFDRSIDHLTGALEVRGVVATVSAENLGYLFEHTKAAKRSTFFLSTIDSDSTLTSLNDQGLIWHMLPGGAEIAVSYQALLARVAAFVKPTGDLKVALVYTPDIRYLSDMRDYIDANVKFNDKSFLQNSKAGSAGALDNYRSYSTKSNGSATDLGPTIAGLLEFGPDVIISLGSVEFFPKIVKPLEVQWDTNQPSRSKPFYIASPDQYNNPSTTAVLTDASSVQSRLIGTNYPAATDPANYNAYLGRFIGAYPEVPNPAGRENFYDGPVYLLNAIAAAGSVAAMNGSDIARGMKRITDMTASQAFNVGPTDMSKMFGVLAVTGTTIKLVGTLGPPDFDQQTGARKGPASLWCVDKANKFVPDILRYDSAKGVFAPTSLGSFDTKCFSGF